MKFLHPPPCKPFLTHGTNARNGCTLGNKCTSFHPLICSTSLTKRECYNLKCNKSHIKGTKRIRPLMSTVISPPNQDQILPQTTNTDFLEYIRHMEYRLLVAMDTKIKAMTTQQTYNPHPNQNQVPMLNQHNILPFCQPAKPLTHLISLPHQQITNNQIPKRY